MKRELLALLVALAAVATACGGTATVTEEPSAGSDVETAATPPTLEPVEPTAVPTPEPTAALIPEPTATPEPAATGWAVDLEIGDCCNDR